MTRRLWIECLFVCALGIVLTGCNPSGPQVVSVAGTLTRNGQPVPNLEIYFMPTQGRPSVGMSDASGKFKLGYTLEQEGAMVSTHKVFVAYNPPAETGYPPPTNLNEIIAKYGSEVSSLKIEVTKPVENLEIKLD